MVMRYNSGGPTTQSSHSFTSGSASTASNHGFHDYEIKCLGHWSSQAYHIKAPDFKHTSLCGATHLQVSEVKGEGHNYNGEAIDFDNEAMSF